MFYYFDEDFMGSTLRHLLLVRNGIRWEIPQHDPANTDYQAYLVWVAEGNTAEEWTGE